MKTVQLNTKNRKQVRDFIEFPFDLYKDCDLWVPPFRNDVRTMMNIPTLFDPKGHPFYHQGESAFFLVYDDHNRVLGRIAVFENKLYNQHHNSHQMAFTLFESVNNQAVANALFEAGMAWGRARGLNQMMGEKGFSSFDGYGVLVEGFEYPQSMTMSKFNYAYYKDLFETAGFEMEVDFNTFTVPGGVKNFTIPEKVQYVSDRVQEKGYLNVFKFKNKKELVQVARTELLEMYRTTFETNWEYYPWLEEELEYAINAVVMLADTELIKMVRSTDGTLVGFLIGFPDVSRQMQRTKGHLTPWGLLSLMRAMKTERGSLILNGAGILPKYQGRGGNALLYTEMKKTAQDYGFNEVEICQIAETTRKMRADMEINLGVTVRKIHRVYRKSF